MSFIKNKRTILRKTRVIHLYYHKQRDSFGDTAWEDEEGGQVFVTIYTQQHARELVGNTKPT